MSATVWTLIITAVGVLIALASALIGGTWAVARSDHKVYQKIDHDIKQIRGELDTLESRFDNRTGQALHDFGEAMSAIRTKVTEVEIWTRDNLVSKHTFQTVITEMKGAWQRLEDKVDFRFDKLEEKIDK